MDNKAFLQKIWNLESINRPALICEEPSKECPAVNFDWDKDTILSCLLEDYNARIHGRCDDVASINCSLGTHIIPCILGGQEKIFDDGRKYLEKPIIYNVGDIDKIKKGDIKIGLVGKQIELIKFISDKTNGDIPIRAGDIQNPLGIAEMMWETSDFYASLYDAPEKVHQLLEIITETVIEYIDAMLDINKNIVPITWPLIWASHDKGVYLADDTMSMVSPDMYEEFGVRYNNKISEVFGGIMLHSCTTNQRYFEKIMMNKNLRSINFAAQYSSDMEEIYKFFGGKIVILPHYCHTDSPQIGTVTEFLEKVFQCWKPEYPTIIYISKQPGSLLQQDVFDCYNEYFPQ